MEYREGEGEGTYFRSDRFYCINCEWFFTTREGREMGPFDDHKEADAELILYVRQQHESEFIEYRPLAECRA